MKHLLSIEKLAKADMEKILAASAPMKKSRGKKNPPFQPIPHNRHGPIL